MRNPILPPLMLLLLSAALYLLPDGSFYVWRLRLRGAFARLHKPPDPRVDVPPDFFSTHRDLLDILAQRDAQVADLNRRLRDLGVTTDNVEKVRIIPARVIALGPDNALDTYTIDVGSRDGVATGQAVVVGQALVGVVVKSEEDASLVLSLSSPGCYMSARLGEPGGTQGRPSILCAVQGTGGGGVKTVVFSSDGAAKEGWIAMTSGLEKGIPEGLLLGTMEGRLAEGVESGTMEAVLEPATDLQSVDFVTVLARE